MREYELFRDVDYGDNDGVRPWLRGFTDSVGMHVAASLLDGVGVVAHDPV